MSKTRDLGNITNVIKVDATGNVSFVSGSTTLATISTSGQMSGSLPALSSSYALSASYVTNAETLDGLDSTVFTLTSSFNTTSASLYTVSSSAYATSGSLSATSGSLSATSGSLSDTSGSLSATSGSLNTRVTALEVTGSALSSSILSVSASSYSTSGSLSSASGSFNTRISTVESKYATTGSNTFTAPQYVTDTTVPVGFANSTGSIYTDGGLLVAKDSYFSGSMFIKGNLTIYGTQSVAYITSSQLNIATNVITVNTATPSVRFGGLNVYDSGSTGTGATGSLFWDSQNNGWVYQRESGSTYSGGMLISGPRRGSGTNLGDEQGTTACMVMVGQGGDHITSSLIYHDSSVTCIPGAIVGGTMSGTTIYGSTAVCSPVGKFTTCIDAGSGMFSGGITSNVVNGYGLIFNRASVTNYNGIALQTASVVKWYIGMRENLSSDNYIIYNQGLATDSLTISASTGAATFSSTITGTTIYGSTTVCSPVGYFSGCVGIGTINPGTKLEVYRCETDRATVTRLLTLNNNSVANPYDGFGMGILFKGTDYSNAVQCYGAIDAVMEFSNRSTPQPDTGFCARMAFSTGTNGALTERMRISSGGNVGIGTCSPCAKLHINGSTGASTYKGFAYTYAGSETLINEVLFQAVVGGYSSNLPIFLFKDERSDQGTTQRIFEIQGGRSGVGTILTTLASGNVGIGTCNPSYLLDVRCSAISGAPIVGNFQSAGGDAQLYVANGTVTTQLTADNTNSISIVGSMTNHPLVIRTNNTERMRITSGGVVELNATDATYINFKYAGTSKGFIGVAGATTDIISGAAAGDLTIRAQQKMQFATGGDTPRMTIDSSGRVTKPYQPAFSAGKSTNESVSAGATVIFNYTSGTKFNVGGYYNASTGIFTAPVAGVYIFSASIIWMNVPNGQAMDDSFWIYKNGDIAAYGLRRAEYESTYTGNGGYYVDFANVLLSLAVGDTVKVVNNRALDIHGNTNYSYFYGYMLG